MQGLLRAGEPPDTHTDPVPQALLRVPLENPTKVPDPKQGSLDKERPSEPRTQSVAASRVWSSQGIRSRFSAPNPNRSTDCILWTVATGQM